MKSQTFQEYNDYKNAYQPNTFGAIARLHQPPMKSRAVGNENHKMKPEFLLGSINKSIGNRIVRRCNSSFPQDESESPSASKGNMAELNLHFVGLGMSSLSKQLRTEDTFLVTVLVLFDMLDELQLYIKTWIFYVTCLIILMLINIYVVVRRE